MLNIESFGGASKEVIKQLEEEIKTNYGDDARLPEDYIKFLVKHNGGHLGKSNSFDLKESDEDGSNLRYFFGISRKSPCERLHTIPDPFTHPAAFPIGEDDFGNDICLMIKGKNWGKIYFSDHESMFDGDLYCKIELIANSFTEFIESLYDYDSKELEMMIDKLGGVNKLSYPDVTTSKDFLKIEKALDIKVPSEFKEKNGELRIENFRQVHKFFDILGEGGGTIIGETLKLRESKNLSHQYVCLASDKNGLILMNTDERTMYSRGIVFLCPFKRNADSIIYKDDITYDKDCRSFQTISHDFYCYLCELV